MAALGISDDIARVFSREDRTPYAFSTSPQYSFGMGIIQQSTMSGLQHSPFDLRGVHSKPFDLHEFRCGK
jgi:hypothetical protein